MNRDRTFDWIEMVRLIAFQFSLKGRNNKPRFRNKSGWTHPEICSSFERIKNLSICTGLRWFTTTIASSSKLPHEFGTDSGSLGTFGVNLFLKAFVHFLCPTILCWWFFFLIYFVYLFFTISFFFSLFVYFRQGRTILSFILVCWFVVDLLIDCWLLFVHCFKNTHV